MRTATLVLLLAAAALAAGCREDRSVAPRDLTPPAAPRGVYSITGDHAVSLYWLQNTESDVVAYKIFDSPCGTASCVYDPIGTSATTSFTVTGIPNGVTRFYAVAAVDRAGNVSDLSYDTVFDTPRPEGFAAGLNNYVNTTAGAGWDFSLGGVRASGDPETDMFFGDNGSVAQMFTPDTQTDIQDAGYGTSLDLVDFAPSAGWSPTGSVELIPGHCYVVWTRDDHYAKFRVTGLTSSRVTFDWAYQVDPGNRELRSRRPPGGTPTTRPIAWIR